MSEIDWDKALDALLEVIESGEFEFTNDDPDREEIKKIQEAWKEVYKIPHDVMVQRMDV